VSHSPEGWRCAPIPNTGLARWDAPGSRKYIPRRPGATPTCEVSTPSPRRNCTTGFTEIATGRGLGLVEHDSPRVLPTPAWDAATTGSGTGRLTRSRATIQNVYAKAAGRHDLVRETWCGQDLSGTHRSTHRSTLA
jgi:hypothetical protein